MVGNVATAFDRLTVEEDSANASDLIDDSVAYVLQKCPLEAISCASKVVDRDHRTQANTLLI